MFSTDQTKEISVKEIDQMLKQWIPVNTIIREQFRKVIIKAMAKIYESGYQAGIKNQLKK